MTQTTGYAIHAAIAIDIGEGIDVGKANGGAVGEMGSLTPRPLQKERELLL